MRGKQHMYLCETNDWLPSLRRDSEDVSWQDYGLSLPYPEKKSSLQSTGAGFVVVFVDLFDLQCLGSRNMPNHPLGFSARQRARVRDRPDTRSHVSMAHLGKILRVTFPCILSQGFCAHIFSTESKEPGSARGSFALPSLLVVLLTRPSKTRCLVYNLLVCPQPGQTGRLSLQSQLQSCLWFPIWHRGLCFAHFVLFEPLPCTWPQVQLFLLIQYVCNSRNVLPQDSC